MPAAHEASAFETAEDSLSSGLKGMPGLWRRLIATDFGAILRGTVQVLTIRVVGAALAYGSMVFLARWLGTFEFGVYAYVWAWVIMLGMALPLGHNISALRFFPNYIAREKWARVQGFLRQSYGVALAMGFAASAIGLALMMAFKADVESYYYVPLLIGLVCLPMSSLLNQLEATARAFGWVNLAYAPSYVVRPFLIIAVLGLMVAFGVQPTANGALWVATGSCFVAIVMQAVPMLLRFRARVPAIKPVFHSRAWCAISASFAVIEGFRMVLENADVALVGKLLDPHYVAIYFATIRTSGMIGFIYFAVSSLAVPKFAKIHGVGTQAELQSFVTGTIRLMFWPSVAAALGLALIGPYALSLFGADFSEGYPVLLMSLGGLVMRSATGPVEYLLTLTGHHRDTMRAYGLGAVTNIGLNLVLIPHFGLMGASIGTYTAFAGVNAYLFAMARRRLGVSAFIFAKG